MDNRTGIIRRFDNAGRIVIPKEYTKILNLKAGEPAEISVSNSRIIINKYESKCCFCNSNINLFEYNGKLICRKCRKKINEL